MPRIKKWKRIKFLGHTIEIKAVFIKGHPAPNVQDHDARGFSDDGVDDAVEDIEVMIIMDDNAGTSLVARHELRELIETAPGFIEACFKEE